MTRSKPFARSIALANLIRVIQDMGLGPVATASALASLPAYRSRGKGRGSANHQHGVDRSKYMPHQGAREKARRVARQWGAAA